VKAKVAVPKRCFAKTKKENDFKKQRKPPTEVSVQPSSRTFCLSRRNWNQLTMFLMRLLSNGN